MIKNISRDELKEYIFLAFIVLLAVLATGYLVYRAHHFDTYYNTVQSETKSHM